MNRKPVSSSRIVSVGWENNTLEVEFPDGAIYQYYDLPYPEYSNFIKSASLGSYLSRIDKRYRYSQIN